MSDVNTWRPLGIESDEEIAEYDALHDGVPAWMTAALWAWVRSEITEYRRYSDGSGRVPHLAESFTEEMCQVLRLPLPNLRRKGPNRDAGQRQLQEAMSVLGGKGTGLQIVDYILAHGSDTKIDDLDGLLERSKSAWTVGSRQGKPGLVRRVPLGVQVGADSVMERAGRAGIRLAKAWEHLYGLNSDPSQAYRLAILAVEDAAIPVVSPKDKRATLGTVLRDMGNQAGWHLPMTREHHDAPSEDVVTGMMRMLWHGQHDRHGGQPASLDELSVNETEATVAVGIATTLVQWFAAGLVEREPKKKTGGK